MNHARDRRRTSHVGRLTVARPVDACLTPALLHALAVHEPERWLSPLARRPGAPQRTRPSRRCRGSLQEEPTDAEFPHPTRRASDHMTVEASAARGGHTTALTPLLPLDDQHLVLRLPTIGVEPECAKERRAAECSGCCQQVVVPDASPLLHAVNG